MNRLISNTTVAAGGKILLLSFLLLGGIPLSIAGEPLSGEQLFIACSGCHEREAGKPNRVGPNLFGLKDRHAGSLDGFAFSPALSDSGLIWNEGTLTAWILAPEAMVPGTWMLYHNELQPDEVSRLVHYLLSAPEAAGN